MITYSERDLLQMRSNRLEIALSDFTKQKARRIDSERILDLFHFAKVKLYIGISFQVIIKNDVTFRKGSPLLKAIRHPRARCV